MPIYPGFDRTMPCGPQAEPFATTPGRTAQRLKPESPASGLASSRSASRRGFSSVQDGIHGHAFKIAIRVPGT